MQVRAAGLHVAENRARLQGLCDRSVNDGVLDLCQRAVHTPARLRGPFCDPWPSPPLSHSARPAPAVSAARGSSSPTAPARWSTSPATTRETTELRVAVLRGQARLEAVVRRARVEEALVGGFFVRPDGHAARRGPHARRRPPPRPVRRAVGRRARVRARARRRRARSRRATSSRRSRAATCCRPARCWCATARRSSAARRTPRASAPAMAQFDSDITDGRYPRAALGLARRPAARGRLRRPLRHDAGPDARGARRADGRARLRDGAEPRRRRLDLAGLRRPPAQPPARRWERPEVGGRPVSTALLFVPRVTCRERGRSGGGRGGVDHAHALGEVAACPATTWVGALARESLAAAAGGSSSASPS